MNVKKIISILILPCLLLIFVQVGLANPSTREMFTKIDDYEIRATIRKSYANKYVFLTMENGLPSENITVYVDSIPVMRFVAKKIKIPVVSPGMMEIRNDSNSVIEVYAQSDDYDLDIINTSFPRGIKSLCRIS